MGTDLLALLKRVVELAMPNLRTYYRITRKAKIVATYASDDNYWADVQPLRNDESVDDTEPVIPKVEIPIMWAGPLRGVVCPPLPGTYCDLTYYDGDPDYPRISNFRWHVSQAPECEVDGFIIQQQPGVHIKIDAESNIIHFTTANRVNKIGGEKNETIGGNWTISVSGSAVIKSDERIEILAPEILRQGNETSTGAYGKIGTSHERTNREHEGSYTLTGTQVINGDVTINGNLTTSGNSHAGSRTGGKI
ncbi:hypothetical protein [Maridesulfovibrio bastinii]|uniref:hypothetical protein n=1 Tax=Maridesulfovibrio bastinii TaxID=47157 RepID=UPI00041C2A13|nr:hypothetical protein [Maridesulfovibrio bastinii]